MGKEYLRRTIHHGTDAPGREPVSKKYTGGRRKFLKTLGLSGSAAVLGGLNLFTEKQSFSLFSAAMAETMTVPGLENKSGLTLLNDRPLNAETPAHLLDDSVTSAAHHFVRNNGIPPTSVDPATWRLEIDGLVDNPIQLSIEDLKKDFEVVTRQLVLECAGNGRKFFDPGAKGNQWSLGAVACSKWTGVRLSDVLKKAGVRRGAVYTAHYGADKHLSGKPDKKPISRGVPIEKALKGDCLIAFEMNGHPIHPMNGAPLRLVVPGWPASCSQKWLTRISIRDQVHDGAKMTGKSYRVPNRPVAPGEKVATADYEIIERMPIKSLITFPQNNLEINQLSQEIRGHAWVGERSVKEVELSIDFGATWQKAELKKAVNPGAWQHFAAKVTFSKKGFYQVWARATDSEGESQPFVINWNPKGYLNNSMHNISLRVV